MTDPVAKLHFYALSEEQDLSRAAERSKTSQRSIRSSLARIEEEYGSQLCILEGKRASLTSAGRRLLRSFEGAGIDDVEDETVSVLQDVMSGSQLASWAEIVATSAWPSLKIEHLHGNFEEEYLDPTHFDLALFYGWPHVVHPELSYIKLYEQDLAAFVADSSHQSELEFYPLQNLRSRVCLVPAPGIIPGLQDLIDWEGRKAGINVRTIRSSRKKHFTDLVRTGSAVGIAPADFLSTREAHIVQVPIEPRISIPFGCLHRTYEASRAVHRFLNRVCNLVERSAPAEASNDRSPANRSVDRLQDASAPQTPHPTPARPQAMKQVIAIAVDGTRSVLPNRCLEVSDCNESRI